MLTWAGEPLNTEADGLMNRRGKLDTIAVNGPEDVAVEWDFVDWRAHEQNVIWLRRRIFKATRERTRNALGACLSRVRGNPLARF